MSIDMNEKTFDETVDDVIRVLREANNNLNKDLSENNGDIKMLLARWQEYVNSIEDLDKRKAYQINIDEANEKHNEMFRLLLQLYKNFIDSGVI
jgi:ABC-type multidrug transport system fused ATPase/permease subunit